MHGGAASIQDGVVAALGGLCRDVTPQNVMAYGVVPQLS